MKVAKLSTDQIVLYLKGPCPVRFDKGEHVLVSARITNNPRRIDPFWAPATQVVWVLDFTGEANVETRRTQGRIRGGDEG